MEIREYLLTKKEDIRDLEAKDRLKSIKENVNYITAVIGPRRAGKTYFLYNLIKKKGLRDEEYLFVNFEENVKVKDATELPIIHQEIYGKLPKFIFFDEIQALREWEKAVYTLYEKKRYCIFITGSSSKLLSKEIATELRGRAITSKIYPFSFKEILLIEKIEKKNYYSSYEMGKIKNLAKKYIEIGSFPDIVLGNISPQTFHRTYLDLVIYKDIIERYGIRNRYLLEYFIRSVISSFAKTFSINKIFNTFKSMNLKVSKKTLYSFQKILEDVGLVIFLKRIGLRKIELTLPKIYLIDNGIFRFTEYKLDYGKFLEATVLQELCKKGFEPNREIYYWRNSSGREVDFILKKGNIKQLIQVTYAVARDEIEKREVDSLIRASELFNCKDLTVITWDYEDELKIENRVVKFLPLWKWLI